MDKRQEIIERFQAFNEYLESIDLAEFKKKYSRQELSELKSTLYKLKTRSLAYEISKLAQKMKEEEYPELLGVHHFPVIKQIDFLTEEQKLALDEFLLKHHPGNYVSGLWHVTRDEKKRKQLEAWLLEYGVIEEQYTAICVHCYDGHMSKMMTKKEKEKLESQLQELKRTHDWDLYDEIMETLEYVCMECDEEFEPTPENIDRIKYKSYYKMKMKRDTSLDKV